MFDEAHRRIGPFDGGAAMRRWILAAFAGLVVALGLAAPASAHASLSRTDPPSGAILANAPRTITLSFTENVRPVADRIRVIGPDRARVDTAAAQVTGSEVTVPVKADAGRGTYLVTYRVISADSHPVAGSFTFSVGSPSADPPTAVDSDNRQVRTEVAVALGVARYLGYAGLVLLVGPLLFLARLWPHRMSRRTPAKLVAAGLGFTALGTLLEMLLQGAHVSGSGLFDISAAALGDALGGTFGTTHALRLAVLAAIAVLLRPFVRPGGPSTVDAGIVGFLGVVGIGTWPLSGHPGASPVPTVSVVADAAHLGAMAVWLGGLVLLGGVLLRRASGRELAAILPVWSSWALLAVVALVVTGVAQSIIEVATPGALVNTRYGRLVLAKIVLLAGVVGLAWYSRGLVVRLAGTEPARVPAAVGVGGSGGGDDPDDGSGTAAAAEVAPASPGLLRRLVLAELAVTAVVLGVAAALVQTPPARSVSTEKAAGPYTVTVTTALYRLRAEVDPVRVGANTLHLYAFSPGGVAQNVVEWRVTVAPTDGSIEPLIVPVLPVTDDHAVAQPNFPTPGEWELRFTLRLSEVDQATATHRLTIAE